MITISTTNFRVGTQAFIAAIVISTSARANASIAPTPTPRTYAVSVDPLTVILGFAHVQFERAFGERFSLYVGPSLRLYDSPFGFPKGDFQGYGVEAGIRGFIWGHAPEGAWIMARGVVAAVAYDGQIRPGGYTSLLGGYTGIFGPGLVVSLGLGASWFSYGPQNGIHGFLPAAHTAIGWAF